MITVTYRKRIRGGWGDHSQADFESAEAAANEIIKYHGLTFATTKPGDLIVLRYSGTLSQLADIQKICHGRGVHTRDCYLCKAPATTNEERIPQQ